MNRRRNGILKGARRGPRALTWAGGTRRPVHRTDQREKSAQKKMEAPVGGPSTDSQSAELSACREELARCREELSAARKENARLLKQCESLREILIDYTGSLPPFIRNKAGRPAKGTCEVKGMRFDYDYVTNLEYKVRAQRLRIREFESGERYAKLDRQHKAEIRKKEAEIGRLKKELARANSSIITNRNHFMEAMEDVLKEKEDLRLEMERRLKKEQDRRYREEARIDELMDRLGQKQKKLD